MVTRNGFIRVHWIMWSVVALSLFLAGCGGAEEAITNILELPDDGEEIVVRPESDPPETTDPEPEMPVLNASLSGRVVDAVSGTPLAGSTVSVSMSGDGEPFTALTDQDGAFLLNAPAGAATTASFVLNGYQTEQYSAVELVADNDLNLGSVRLVSNDNAGLGTLTGTISNAVDGTGVEGLTLRFRQGINVTEGDVFASTTTDVNGDYTVTDLSYGNWTCEIVGVGFDTSFANVIALGNIIQSDQNTAVSPDLSTGEIRIVLTWGSTPSDLDSHLTGPLEGTDTLFHVYYLREDSDLVNLDVDDVSSFGPETVTIERQINGVYRYTVHNFSGNNELELSASGARVQVFDAGGLIRDYQVPAGVGNLWTVFDMEGGNITTINTISERTNISQHFPPSEQAKVSSHYSLPAYK